VSDPARPLPPGAERRRLLRQQQRHERLRNSWRVLVLLGLAGGLGYGLLRQGWILQEASQVEVEGSRLVTAAEVIKAAGIRFPQPLLGLDPRRVAAELAESLPVEDVQVSRLMAPPRLRVALVDREAVARAERRGPRGSEFGYVDRLGHWMGGHQGQALRAPGAESLLVEGWQPRHRLAVAQVLQTSRALGNDLQRVRIDPAGSLWVDSASLGPVRLGPGDAQLGRRLEVLGHLVATLPARLGGRRPQNIDLSDPEQPELTLPGRAAPTPVVDVRRP
jgi:cell division protein FtsQ